MRRVLARWGGLAALIGVVAVAAVSLPALAGPFEDAVAAYERGDYETALRLYRPLADQGDAKARFNLGLMYVNGRGVAQDYAEAVKWYRKAADQGHADARLNLELMYATGRGVPPDDAEAAEWRRRAADRDNAVARFILGDMRATGRASAPAAPEVSSDSIINNLEPLVAKGNLNEAFKLIQSVPFAVDEKNERLAEWVLANQERLNALFLTDLSGRVFLRDRVEGLKWHFVSRMWASYDAARCTDSTASQGLSVLGGFAKDVSSYVYKHRVKGAEEISSAMAAAVAWEKDHPSPASPLWICRHGMSAYRAAVDKTPLPPEKMLYPKEEWPAIRERKQGDWAKMATLKITTDDNPPDKAPAEQAPELSIPGSSVEAMAAAAADKEAPRMNKDIPSKVTVSLKLIRELDHDYGIKRIVWSQDGRYIASTGIFSIGDMVWDAETGKLVMTAKKRWIGPGGGIGFSPDGRYLITSPAIENMNGLAATVWDLRSKEIVRHLVVPHQDLPDNAIQYAMFSPEGRFLILAYSKGGSKGLLIGVYDASSWELIRSFGHEHELVRSMAISPDGQHLAFGTPGPGTVKVWDYHTGDLVKEFKAQSGSVNAIAYSPDGKFLVTGGDNTRSTLNRKTGVMEKLADDDLVRVWNTDDYKMAWSYAMGKVDKTVSGGSSVRAVAYSPDNRYIAVNNIQNLTANDMKARNLTAYRVFHILDGRSAQVLKTVPVPMHILSLAFSPKGDALAVSGDDTIMIWRIKP
ncbi:MAG: hypothetical protein A3G18_00815 [Rhodospirillales bacterium RIFCSPLOWO2_12_FULL_58_28]|nr:MAG: hypothetical protein A3H92_12660 [Rhodospirillales bacterium RIFCSPLOWO2_02_FULL_58_16]OHC77064.1 MAG: hypothetical protein A3G18_00815 [Rhodospirillales bacterium RIFCSPLOWO2_12_FULL_58_28]